MAAVEWRFGNELGMQVWTARGDRRVRASLLIDHAGRAGVVLLLNAAIIGTEQEGDAIRWALALVADGRPGFYVLRAG